MSRQCNKIKHKGFEGAIKQAGVMQQKEGKKYTIYFCNGCNSYHITSKRSKQFIKTVH